jgi:hypothetical protein
MQNIETLLSLPEVDRSFTQRVVKTKNETKDLERNVDLKGDV